MTYEEYKISRRTDKYKGLKCYIPNCNKLAEYEVGDSRFYCGMCEEHAGIAEAFSKGDKHRLAIIKRASKRLDELRKGV